MNASPFRRRISLLFAALLLTPLVASAASVSMDFKVLIDSDNKESTGCTIVTTAGLIRGVDHVLTTNVSFDGSTATVTGVTRQSCVDSVANAFSVAIPVATTGWSGPVTSGGNFFLETFMPLSAFGGVTNMRYVFTVSGGNLADTVMLDVDGNKIIFPPLPTFRRHSSNPAGLRTITLDNNDPDWAGIEPMAEGGSSGSPSLRFLSVRILMDQNNVFFGIAAQSNANAPTANDDAYSVERGKSIGVAVPGVLSNDTDPNNKPLTAILLAGTQHGALTLNADGSFNYQNDGSQAPSDSFEYKANNGSADSNAAHVDITITEPNAGPPPVKPAFTSPNNTRFQAGTQKTFNITTTPLHPAVTVTKQGGNLPAGVGFFATPGSGTAQLSGNPQPNTGGTYPLIFRATNTVGFTDQNFTLTVCNIIAVTNPATSTATANTPFSQAFTQTGAVGTATFSTASVLPAGLSLSSAGALSGTPTVTGSFPIVVTVTDSQGCTGSGTTYNLTVGCQTITVNNPATTTGTANAAFSQTFTATNAIAPVTFSLNSGTLPAGLTLSSAGVLSGTPTVVGTFPITVKATDKNGCFGVSATYNLVINCQTITVNNPATNTGTVNVAFSQSFTASNTIGATTFSTASTLPAGLTLSSGGVLSGTPTQTGSFPIVVKATDANGCQGTGATYTLTINCQVITVNNPSTNTGTVNVAFSQAFTASNTIGAVTFSTASTLPAGLTLSSGGVLSGTPTQTGTFPIVVHAVDANGCSGNGATYNLTINCQVIGVTNPSTNTGTVNVAFSQNFTASNTIGTVTFSTTSTLPAGLTLATNGTLSGTPTQSGTFPIVVKATDANGCSGTGATYNLTIACQVITVTNPTTNTGTVNVAFSQTFTAGNTIGTVTFTTASALPAGLTLATNGTLSGIPTQTGSFPIVVKATDANGCSGTGSTYTLTIGCQVITVTNPSTNSGTAASPFSQTFTAGNTIGAVTFSSASTLPTGLTLHANGTLDGTPTQTGPFPIVVTATDANGCSGNGPTYNLTINCQTITVTNPTNNTGTVSSPFSEQFTQSGAIGTATFSTASTLPNGITLSGSGLLSGTPTQNGSFSIVVTVTDSNGCTGSGATYNLTINCQVITVTNPTSNTDAAGTALVAANFTFTQSGAVGGATFNTASTLPPGVTLTTGGVLTGTPTGGALDYPITVTVTDGNGCTGTSSGYILHITCPTITVTNPGTTQGTAGVAFSQTFTQSGGQGTIAWSESGTLPTGFNFNTATGVLSGTTHQVGSFPITVTATDQYGCQGTGSQYALTIICQTVTVTNPGTNTGTVDAAFSQTFTVSGILDTVAWSETGNLPAGITLNSSTGVLSGTPTVNGVFPIVVKATDTNGCFGTSNYTLTINCQTITVTNPVTNTGTVDAPFSQQFTQSGAHATATFTLASGSLPAGLSLSTAGLLSGTPTVPGNFPITVMVTDANGCTGTGATYNLTINCQTITVTNPSTNTGTVDAAFSQQFTQSGAHGTATFSTASALPAGLTLDGPTGVLSGTPTVKGTFPIVVTVTDSNGCTGSGATYNLTINCQTITVTNPTNNTGTVSSPFSEQFTQTGAHGTATFSTASTLPNGITLSSAGLLSGTPTQSGPFPIVVTVTDSNGCTGSGATYNLTINCQVITVTNPTSNSDPAGTPLVAANFTFTQSGAVGGATFNSASTFPTGVTLTTGGVLTGTPTQGGSFPITVTVTDGNGCTGTSSGYTLTITCPVITVTNPGTTQGTAGTAFSQTFTQSGGQGTIAWSESGTLPTGFSFNTSTGVLSGTTHQVGAFPITVTATDANGCQGTGSQYNLTINCQTITVTNPGVNTGTRGTAFSQTFGVSGILDTVTWSESGALPAGITLNSATGVLSGTPTVHGVFPITVKATDTNGCFGTSPYTLTINCQTITVTNPSTTSGLINTAFSQQFTQSGAIGGATFTTSSTLPNGLTLATDGTLSGTPTQSGSFPITVTVTDGDNCTGVSATYNLYICPVLSVTNPGNNTGTAGSAFSAQFTQSGGVGTITWSTTGTLPSGISIDTSTGLLSGTTSQTGSFPITATATDQNGCTGTGSTYTFTISCQTISITNPNKNSIQTGGSLTPASDWTFTATNILGTATWSITSGTLPSGISFDTSTGILSGSSTALGTYPLTVKVTDTNGCFATTSYTLTITCPTITITRVGGGSFPAATFNVGYPAGNQFQATCSPSCIGTIHWAFQSGAQPPGINLTIVAGTLSGIPSATGQFTMTVIATDGNGCTGTASFPFTIKPNVSADSYSNLVNNTEAYVTGGSTAAPSTPAVQLSGTIVSNDTPASGVTVDASTVGTFATTQGGSVNIASDGTFKYRPPVTASPLSSDTFTYTASSNTGTVPSIPQYAASTGPATNGPVTVTLNLANRIWYVNNSGSNGNGQSQSPFNSLSNFTTAGRLTPDASGDIIYVYNGDGTTTNQNAGVTLLANEQLIGQGVALLNPNDATKTLVAAGTKPQITNTGAAVVTLASGNTVKGVTLTGGTRGMSGSGIAGLTADTFTVSGGSAEGMALLSTTGTITITNGTISGGTTALDIDNGTSAISVDNTNTISSSGTQRTVIVQNRPASAGTIALGATINDSGAGILVTNNSSGTINFTGTQTLSTTTNTAVNLTTNTGTTINFSGTLGVTSTTGTGFNATGGGTLNVTGTANVTTGAAAAGININGVTVGASGATFAAVNTTGATTGVGLTSIGNGNVTINGGTISGGTTGLSMSTLGTSTTTLSGVTLTGSGTAISGSTFGTLAISGSAVNVSGATALNLATGAVSGTFNNVTSSGGTNGVNLSAVTGSWGTTGGALTGATGSTFNVSGGSGGTISWGGTINQANGANAVTIAGSNSNTINFSGNVTTSGTSTGISISASTGTYNFTGGASTITGTGGGITIFNEASGTISFGSGYNISAAAPGFKIGGSATNVGATITYSGVLTPPGGGGTLIDVNSASGTFNGSLTFNGTTLGGSVNNPAGVTTVIKNMTGTLVVNHLNLTSNHKNFNGTLLAISGTNTAGSFTFNNLTLAANGTGGGGGGTTGTGLTMSGGGTLTITATGGSSSIDVSNKALDLNGIALGASTLATVNAAGGVNGVNLTSVTGGTLTITGGTLSGATGSEFLVSGGSATVSCGATITQSTAGQRTVDISTISGGTLTFSGAINTGGIFVNANTGGTINFTGSQTISTGTSAGVTLTTNGGVAMNFTGGSLSVTTTSGNGFTATGGGTITVTGANNTVTTTTGTAVNITSTTIGATNVIFKSVSANGGTNGIFLSSTGSSGNFQVTGNVASVTNDGSGGTITGMTGADASPNETATVGAAIYLNSTQSPSFNHMNISNCSNYGLVGTNVTNFTMTYTTINGTNGTSQSGTGEGDVYFTGLSGSATVSNSTFTGGIYDTFHVFNDGGQTLNRITFTSCTFATITGAGNLANDALVLQATNGTLNVTVQSSTFTAARGDLFQINLLKTVSSDLVFTGNTLSNNNGNIVSGGGGITLGGGGPSQVDTFTFNIANNTMRDASGPALAIGAGTGAGTTHNYSGTINNNTIGVQATANSGSAQGSDISFIFNDNGTATVSITNNHIYQWNGEGIFLELGAVGSANSYLNATVTGNTIASPGGAGSQGLLLTAGTQPSPIDTGRVCLTMTGNSMTGSGGNGTTDIRIRDRFDVKVGLPTYAGPSGTGSGAAVQTFLSGNNGGCSASVPDPSLGTTNGTTNGFFGSCPP